MIRLTILPLLAFLLTCSLYAQITSPAQYLGYELGEQWTPHHKVTGYFQQVAEESNLVSVQSYGTTYEGRELMLAFVTSQANQAKLETIRTDNLKRTGFLEGETSGENIPLVWLSYNVHGNEASATEAAINTLHQLVAERSTWLDHVVVILDPTLNPDGRDRYVNWNRSVTGAQPNVHPESREHNEPWPGGRVNHYYFDLNRDWAWQTQTESQQRVQEYLNWMPHVHVDFHEQGYNSPYYFAPAAEPFHTVITEWQREFQTIIGRNNARYFDEEGWLYFTREVFDLFYPSYGDTWPTFNGAIGMTYEQAGHSRAGLGIITSEGDTLTLNDRLTHHTTTGLSTVEMTVQNRERVLEEFEAYFQNTIQDGSGNYATYVVKRSNNPDKVARLLRYLVDQNITFSAATSSSQQNGFDYSTGREGRVRIEEGDYLISTHQPQGNLVRVLFEPDPELVDSLTYDITAWEAHYAYGLEGYALTSKLEGGAIEPLSEEYGTELGQRPYAYLAKWNAIEDAQFLGQLLQQKVKVRYAERAFTMNGKAYDAGTLIITRTGNEQMGARFDEVVKLTADLFNRTLDAVETGFVDTGKDFGSSYVRYIKAPKVALIAGEGTSGNMVGHVWHYFDQQLGYPVTLVNRDDLSYFPWQNYDVVVMPSGSYSSVLGKSALDDVKSWIRDGGTLIALEGANRFLAGKDGFSLKRKSADRGEDEDDPEARLRTYEASDRESMRNLNAGSIYQVKLDKTHPLAFGYGDSYFSLKLGSTAYEYLENGWNVGATTSGTPRSGFVGSAAQDRIEHSLSFGVQNLGAGEVIYLVDNPLFRGFWHNGKLLVANALFFVGN
ncbi:MAG: M14 family metallopeptidase [Bacteroidota bacterium]